MKCEEFRNQVARFSPPEVRAAAESEEIAEHALTCLDCQQLLETRWSLEAAFNRVVAETCEFVQIDKTESAILAEFDRFEVTKNGSRQMKAYLSFGIAFACSACLILVMFVIHRQHALRTEHKFVSREPAEQFIAVPYVVPLAPYERAEVVRTQVSRAALTALGFDVHGPDVSGSVTADLECGQDGRVVAVSLIQDSEPKRYRRVDR